MDDMDDFGDLYGDLDRHMKDKKEEDKIEAKTVGVDSAVEQSELNGKVGKFEDKGMVKVEEQNNNNSDSDDDDFRIVLNEDECPKFQQPSRGGITGIDEEDETDNIADHLHSDQFPATVADESMQGSEARGFAVNGGSRPARHVGTHLAGFTSSARASLSGRGSWDNPLMTCFQGASSYKRDISAAAQTGVTFCLPRHRTIFDINIEAFQQKPWRHHGADITDYFNFGLDEESWKNYCEALDQFRKQATMSNRFPVYQSSRLNQGEKNSFVMESLEKGGRGFDVLKGRAIQVEGGLGERVPSTDMARRPRALDSDVVIQINMEDSVEDASDLCKDSLEHAEDYKDASQSTSGNHSNERVVSPHYDGHIGRHITSSIEHWSELNGSNSRVTSGKDKSNVDCKEDKDDLIKTRSCMLEVGSDSGDQVLHGSSSCNLQSHSQESKGVLSMGNDTRPIEKASVKELQDSIESDYYLSYDSISDATETEQEDNKDDARDRDISSGEYKHFSRTRLRSVAELNVANDDEQTSSVVHRKRQNDLDLWDIRFKTRKRKSTYDTNDVRGHSYSYHETEDSLSYKSRKHVAKHSREKYFTEDSRKGDCVAPLSRNRDEDCLEQRECYIFERGHEDRDRSSLSKYSDRSTSKNESFFMEKDSCLRLAKERDEHWIRMDPEYDDVIHDYRYRGRCVRDMHGRHTYLYDTEEENLDPRFQRHVYPTDRKIRSPERSRYDRRPSFENRPNTYIESDVDQRLVPPRYAGPNNTDERGWHDDCSPREHLRFSWRSNGRYVNHRGHPNIGDLQFKNKKYGRVDPSIRDHHHLAYEDGLESDIDGYISEDVYGENIVSSVQRRRCTHLSRPDLHTDGGARFRHCEQGGLPSPERFLLERRSKHDNFQVSKPFFRGHRLPGGRLLNNARKMRVVGKSDSDARDHLNFVPVMDRHELAAVGCRKAVNKHLNGFTGKLARRYSGVPGESEKEIGTRYKENHLKNFRHLKQACQQEAIYPHISKGEGSHTHQTDPKVDRLEDSKSFNSDDHAKTSVDKFAVSQSVEDNEIEEGELIEDSDKQDVASVTKDWNSGKKVDKFQSKDSSSNGKVAGIYDNNRILATLAKMEKRMERFKEPIAPKQGSKKNVNPQVDVSVVSDEVKEQRPARKRRWGGSK